MNKIQKYHLALFLSLLSGTALQGQNTSKVCLKPNASFLYQPYPHIADHPVIIDLKALNVKAKDTLQLRANLLEENSTKVIGVFSKDSLLLPHHQLERILNAIDVGVQMETPKSLFSAEITDIEQDFVVNNQVVIVPEKARFLFLGNQNAGFTDNKDSVCINLKSTEPSWQFEIKTIAKVRLLERQAKILLWDGGNEDGDLITVYLNGEKLLDHHEVIRKRYKLQLNLKEKYNELVIYAENTGRLGDNTAVVLIKNSEPYRKFVKFNAKGGTAKRIVLVCEK
ncbi:MAG: hypothetical protein AAGG68_01365 [Bacteroidota bacterium]